MLLPLLPVVVLANLLLLPLVALYPEVATLARRRLGSCGEYGIDM